MDEIRTPRLHLRPLAAGDIPALARLLGEPATHAWMPALGRLPCAADAAALLHACLSGPPALFDLVVLRAGTVTPMGQVTLSAPDAELQYWLGPAHWGRGFASEAVQATLATPCVRGLARPVQACVHRDNRASQRVLEKSGFRFAGLRWRRFADQRVPVPVLDYRR